VRHEEQKEEKLFSNSTANRTVEIVSSVIVKAAQSEDDVARGDGLEGKRATLAFIDAQ
jgi:hypothetical protein